MLDLFPIAQEEEVSWRSAVADVVTFYKCMLFYLSSASHYTQCPYFANDNGRVFMCFR
jgi:hypothetical protein